jgi:hypothetical protein
MSLSETRLDDVAVGMFQRDLEIREARVLEKKRAPLPFADGLIVPIEVTDEPWAQTWSYKQVTAVGQMELIRDYTTTVPMVDVLSEEVIGRIYEYGLGYYVGDKEAYASQHLGQPIEDQKIAAAYRTTKEQLNKLISLGDPRTGTPGFLNHPDFLRMVAPYPINSTSTSDQLTTTLTEGVTAMLEITNNAEAPDTVLLPRGEYEFLMNRRLDNAADAMTVMKAFLQNNDHIKNIQPLNELKGAGPEGQNIMVVYRRDPEAVKYCITSSFKFKELLRKPWGFQRPGSLSVGGIKAYYPFAVLIVYLPS